MARRKMMGSKHKGRVIEPTRKAVYKQRVAKPEPDMIPKRPRQRSNRPKGFI